MKQRLLIINNVSKKSTVLDAFLDVSKNTAECIDVVFPRLFNAEEQYGEKSKNIHYLFPGFSQKTKAFFAFVKDFFSAESFRDFKLAHKSGKLSPAYLKEYIKAIGMACMLYEVSKNVVKSAGTSLLVISTWYSHNAVAAAMLKRKYPMLTAVSYAHSYEIDPVKNNYVTLIRDRFKEKHLDAVYFISRVVMENYCRDYGMNLNHMDKYEPIHFGSEKKASGISQASSDHVFRILTCSGINPVKRLDVFASALALYGGDASIEWAMIGSGSDFDKIKQIVESIRSKNVKVIIFGKYSNAEVHDYYVKHNVDLFVNISASEGLPVSAMEAMSYGVPVLATDVGGNREIVTADTGYLIDADITPESICDVISEIVSDPEACRAKRANAYTMWEEHYQISDNVNFMLQKTQSLQNEKGQK